jgi:xanthine/CO dehydrogenase XdhC/CoxF family maturation factor
MKELQDIVNAYEAAVQLDQQMALATVVHVEGSSYRRAGARMLVTEDGQLTGAISGGCLEGDALRKARLAMVQRQPMLVTYDTTDDDDAKFGVGLGCNGIIHILIEPIAADQPQHPIMLFKDFLSKRQSAILVTLFSLADKKAPQPGTCLLLKSEDESLGQLPGIEQRAQISEDAHAALRHQLSVTKTYPGNLELTVFIELLQPAVALTIFGAGNDTVPMVQLAAVLGWQVTVVDGRANYAVKERFPLAKQVITAKPEQAIAQLQFDHRSAAVLMTHNYNYDLAILRGLISAGFPYLGALGPKKKLNRLLDELADEGMQLTEQQLERLYGPAGLDVGAETSDEIALSIIAEIQAVLQGTSGSFLRDKEFIHQRHPEMVINSVATSTEFKTWSL